jgi:hypothetical protein
MPWDSDQVKALQALDSSTQFSSLPIELRLQIWRETFPAPQSHLIDDRCSPGFLVAKTVRHPIPATLHVDRESREETLRHYTMIWFDKDRLATPQPSNDRPDQHKLGKKSGIVVINPKQDSVFINLTCLWCYVDTDSSNWLKALLDHYPETIRAIKTLDLGIPTKDSSKIISKRFVPDIIGNFESLKEIRAFADFPECGHPVTDAELDEAQSAMRRISITYWKMEKEMDPTLETPKLTIILEPGFTKGETSKSIHFEMEEYSS